MLRVLGGAPQKSKPGSQPFRRKKRRHRDITETWELPHLKSPGLSKPTVGSTRGQPPSSPLPCCPPTTPTKRGAWGWERRNPRAGDTWVVLIYDGDCGFCRRCADWLRARGDVPMASDGEVDRLALGLTPEETKTAVWWVEGRPVQRPPGNRARSAASWRWLGAGRLVDPYAAGVMARSCRLPVGGGQPAPVWLKERGRTTVFQKLLRSVVGPHLFGTGKRPVPGHPP